MKKYLLSILLLFVFSSAALWPLLQPGFFITDDAEWMIIRMAAFYTALHDGQFPVRFLHTLNFGYGYPVVTFLYPGLMYAGIPFIVLDFGFTTTIKILLGLSLFGSTLFIFLWLSNMFSKKVSFLAALLSLYLPYHLYDVFVRGSVGELFALVWVAFTLWMLERRSIFFSGVGICLLLISHNTLAILFMPLLFVYALSRLLFPLKKLLIIFLLGILGAAFFLMPLLFELPLTQFTDTLVADPLAYFAPLSLIGISSLLVLFFALLLLPFKKVMRNNWCFWLFFGVSILSIFLSSNWSSVLWTVIPSSWIQFPYRLLSYLIITIPFLAAVILSQMKGWKAVVLALVFILGATFSAFPYLSPKERMVKDDAFYFTNEATTTVQDEYMPKWVKEKPVARAAEKAIVAKGEGKITETFFTNNRISFVLDLKQTSLLQINTIFWPGWKAFVDGRETDITYANPKGLMEIIVPEGKHTVQFTFTETPIRLVADNLSILALIGLLGYSLYNKKYEK